MINLPASGFYIVGLIFISHKAALWTEMIGMARVYAQNPLHQFPHNFPVDGEADNLLQTCYTDLLRACYGETGVMDLGL